MQENNVLLLNFQNMLKIRKAIYYTDDTVISFISHVLLNFLITFILNQGLSVPNVALLEGVHMPLRSNNSSKETPEVTHWRVQFICLVGLVFPLF